MAKVNGIDITEARSGGGGGIADQIMGVFRERSRAQRQLEMMAFGSALDVASKAAETEVTANIGREALVKDFQTFYEKDPSDPTKFKNPELAKHISEAGLESTPYGYKFSPSSLTKVEKMRRGVGEFEQYKAPVTGVTPTTGAEKPRKGGSKSVKGPVAAPVVNEAPQTIAPANVGVRAPRVTKGGYKQPALPGMARAGAKPAKSKKAPKVAPTGGTPTLGMGEMPSA